MKDILPEVIAGVIAIFVIVFDALIVAYQITNKLPVVIPEVFGNLTFAVVAVYFTQQAAAKTAQRIGTAVAQANVQSNEARNGTSVPRVP